MSATEKNGGVDDRGKKLADYALFFELFSEIGGSRNEREIIDSISGVFHTICTPAYVAYLPFYGDKWGSLKCRPRLTAERESEIAERLAGFDKEYAWTGSGNGFVLLVSLAGEKLGVVELEGIAFPEYREHYLNLALNSAGVLGMAVNNARNFQRLEEKNRALEISESRYRLLVQSSPFCVHEIAMDGLMMSMNKAGLDMLGLKDEKDVVGTPYLGSVSLQDKGRVEALMRAAFAGTLSQFEFDSVGGAPRRFKSCFVPIRGSGGAVTKLMGITEDVTERKDAEKKILDSEAKWRGLFSILPVGVSILNPNREVVSFNPELGKMLDLTTEGLRDWKNQRRRYLRSDMSEMSQEEFPSHIAINENRVVKNVEIGVVKEDGATIWTDVSAAPLPPPDACVVVTSDITNFKAAVEKIKTAKEAAEEATRLKDKFISLVAHDLKNPLGTMVGFLKVARSEYGAELNKAITEILDLAIDSGTQMSNLISDLLKVSRFKIGRPILKQSFFDAKYLGVEITDNYSKLASRKGIELANMIPENSRIYADRPLLSEAVHNLVLNSIKFCKKGDRVSILLAGPATICVQDTGPGITPGALEKIFRYEEKTSTTGTAGETGTGFGLPLTKDIVEFHGGEMIVKSEPGKGSTFGMKLPIVRPKILVLDDDKTFRDLLRAYLKVMDVDVMEADEGREALSMIESASPHLIILDLMLPDIDGLELLKRVKSGLNTKETPVFVVSGQYGMDIRDTVFKLGADEFVSKGKIDRNDLIPRIRRFIG